MYITTNSSGTLYDCTDLSLIPFSDYMCAACWLAKGKVGLQPLLAC